MILSVRHFFSNGYYLYGILKNTNSKMVAYIYSKKILFEFYDTIFWTVDAIQMTDC